MLRKAFWTTAALLYGVAILGLGLVATGAGAGFTLMFVGGFLGGSLFALLGNYLEQDSGEPMDHGSPAHPA